MSAGVGLIAEAEAAVSAGACQQFRKRVVDDDACRLLSQSRP
jgi:hypothetical protein